MLGLGPLMLWLLSRRRRHRPRRPTSMTLLILSRVNTRMALLRRTMRIARGTKEPIQWTWWHSLLLLLFLLPLFLLTALLLLSSQLLPFLLSFALILCFATVGLVICFGLPTEAAATCLALVAVLQARLMRCGRSRWWLVICILVRDLGRRLMRNLLVILQRCWRCRMRLKSLVTHRRAFTLVGTWWWRRVVTTCDAG